MAKSLFWIGLAVFVVGCGSPTVAPTAQKTPAVDPQAQPAISQTAEKAPASAAEVKKVLDLEEYPGAEVVENNKLVSSSLPPDEIRFELVRRSKDAPTKVIAFYEKALGAQASGEAGHKEVFGRTKRGNFVRAHFDAEGSGTKYSLSVISFAK